MNNAITYSRLAAMATSLLGILAALMVIIFIDGWKPKRILEIIPQSAEEPGITSAALVLLLNGLWLGPIIYLRCAHRLGLALFSGMVAALLSLIIACIIGYGIQAFAILSFDYFLEGIFIYTLYSLMLGGIPASLLGISLGYHLFKKGKQRTVALNL